MIKYWTEKHNGSTYIFADNGKEIRVFDLAGRLVKDLSIKPSKGGAGE